MITTPAIPSPRIKADDNAPTPLRGPERVDGIVLLAIGFLGTVLTYHAIDWIAFFILFSIIDVVGYLPGVMAARLTGRRQVSAVFVHLYNVTHSNAGGLAIALIYCLLTPATAPSTLAIAVHLGIDRGILANRLKRPGEIF
ncbi:MAG: hypothetical protein J0M19_01110 [Sphingomonadales bacterium]|nr:hypothetical protein [Sphingomonadales bacterium]